MPVDVACVVNPKARRGSENVARELRRTFPGAPVLLSHSLSDLDAFAGLHRGPSPLFVTAGGDGTVLALVNALRRHGEAGRGEALAHVGILPLGTGNAWAYDTGAPGWHEGARRLRAAVVRGAVPRRRYELVEVDGIAGHFAGTGWDAEVIEDFHRQKTGRGILPMRMRQGVAGYFHGLFMHTIPRNLRIPPAIVTLTNTGPPALGVDEAGRPYPIPGGGTGEVLYHGPASVCAAATSISWGFGFKAFPFAGLVDGRFCFRIYAGNAAEATLRIPQLWQGKHPMAKMHTWLLSRCRAEFDRPVPFQIGGDRLGMKTSVEYSLAQTTVDLVDWRRVPRA